MGGLARTGGPLAETYPEFELSEAGVGCGSVSEEVASDGGEPLEVCEGDDRKVLEGV